LNDIERLNHASQLFAAITENKVLQEKHNGETPEVDDANDTREYRNLEKLCEANSTFSIQLTKKPLSLFKNVSFEKRRKKRVF
jgi:hypothetical protein